LFKGLTSNMPRILARAGWGREIRCQKDELGKAEAIRHGRGRVPAGVAKGDLKHGSDFRIERIQELSISAPHYFF
jgi:hypothetical protein